MYYCPFVDKSLMLKYVLYLLFGENGEIEIGEESNLYF